jgi:glutathione S-transferase
VKLYESSRAPNPRRVRIFLAEKGVDVPAEQVDLAAEEQKSSEFTALNPLQRVPVLVLDDGTVIAESIAICRYFERLRPEPALFGRGAKEEALVEMWNRRMELNFALPVMNAFRHTHPFFKDRIEQVPDFGHSQKRGAIQQLEWLDGVLADREFIAGDAFSIADITALVGVDFGRISDIRIGDQQANLKRWYDAVASRPSAKA